METLLSYNEKLEQLNLLMEAKPPTEQEIDQFWLGYEQWSKEYEAIQHG